MNQQTIVKDKRYRISWLSYIVDPSDGKLKPIRGVVDGLVRHVRAAQVNGGIVMTLHVESPDPGPEVELCAECGVREVVLRHEQIEESEELT